MHLVKLVLMGTEKDTKGNVLGYRRLDSHNIIPTKSVKILNKPSLAVIHNEKPVTTVEKKGLSLGANALLLGNEINSTNPYNHVYIASYCKISLRAAIKKYF